MIRGRESIKEEEFFSLPLAKWVVGVLAMLIAVVGKESLLGLILGQTRSEISGLIRDEEPARQAPQVPWYENN
jgi:hypothetical protein